jgi:hypothetical protein
MKASAAPNVVPVIGTVDATRMKAQRTSAESQRGPQLSVVPEDPGRSLSCP